MADRSNYEQEEIITLEFDDGDKFECGIMGIFDHKGKDYIALEALDGSDDVYIYGYVETEDDFELQDIPTEEEFNEVEEEFYRLINEPV